MGADDFGKMCDADESTIEVLVDRHFDGVLKLLTRLTGSFGIAEEVAQEAFLNLAKGWSSLGSPDQDRLYLYKTVYNAWRRWYRRSRRWTSAAPELALDAAAADPSPVDELIAREKASTVWSALSGLPENQRAALVFIVLGGMSYKEVAAIMGVERDTVASWRARGLERMRQTMLDGSSRVGKTG